MTVYICKIWDALELAWDSGLEGVYHEMQVFGRVWLGTLIHLFYENWISFCSLELLLYIQSWTSIIKNALPQTSIIDSHLSITLSNHACIISSSSGLWCEVTVHRGTDMWRCLWRGWMWLMWWGRQLYRRSSGKSNSCCRNHWECWRSSQE